MTWSGFWHAPADLRVVAAFRVAFGALVALSFLLQEPFVELWWGDAGLVPRDVARGMLHPDEPSLLLWLPESPLALRVCWALVIVQAEARTPTEPTEAGRQGLVATPNA